MSPFDWCVAIFQGARVSADCLLAGRDDSAQVSAAMLRFAIKPVIENVVRDYLQGLGALEVDLRAQQIESLPEEVSDVIAGHVADE